MPEAIDMLLETAGQGCDLVQPAELGAKVAAGALAVDIRPVDQRYRLERAADLVGGSQAWKQLPR